MSQQLAIQQQLESINQQQQQLSFTYQQYANMGMLPPQQHLSPAAAFNPQGQLPPQIPNLSPNMNAFQFPHQMQQQQQLQTSPNIPSHRRNQSALPTMGMGPPPAPSSGASGSSMNDFGQMGSIGLGQREMPGQRGGRGGGHAGSAGGGHQRRHSLAVTEAKKAAELAQQKRTTSGFQFPVPGATQPDSSPDLSTNEIDEQPGQLHPQNASQASTLNPLAIRSGNRGGSHGRSQSAAIGMNGRPGAQGRSPNAFQFPSKFLDKVLE